MVMQAGAVLRGAHLAGALQGRNTRQVFVHKPSDQHADLGNATVLPRQAGRQAGRQHSCIQCLCSQCLWGTATHSCLLLSPASLSCTIHKPKTLEEAVEKAVALRIEEERVAMERAFAAKHEAPHPQAPALEAQATPAPPAPAGAGAGAAAAARLSSAGGGKRQ